MTDRNSHALVAATWKILHDHKAEDILVYDLSERYDYAEYAVLSCGNSAVHLKALTEKIRFFYKQQGYQPYAKSLPRSGEHYEDGWVVLDYQDVVVHLFLREKRTYYGLDDLMGQARSVQVGV